jgi:precorrin-2 methylase
MEDREIIKLREHLAEAQREIEHWRHIAQQTPVPIVVEHGDHTEVIGQTNLILQAERSKLHKAIRALVEAHTRDNQQIGFTVEGSPMLHPYSELTRGEYIEAWATLRKEMHEQTEPLP